MDFDDLAFWWPESGDPVAADRAGPIFSPLPREYGSYLEAMEMEWQEVEAPNDDLVALQENNMGKEREVGGAEENEEEGTNGGSAQGSKNMLSERNRRKRLNQQLIALRSLVPYMSKMDKRSILMDAATYLQNLHKDIEQLKREIAEQEASQESHTSDPESNQTSSPQTDQVQEEASSNLHRIFKIETDEADDRTLTVKVVFQKARGATAQVQRMIESLGTSVTHTWTHENGSHQMITTSFINVKKQMSMTAEVLKEHMNKTAIKMGFEIDLDD